MSSSRKPVSRWEASRDPDSYREVVRSQESRVKSQELGVKSLNFSLSYSQLVKLSGVIIWETYCFTKVFFMDNMQKLNAINKIIRELEDIGNSSTALLKKIAQVEAENINLGNKIIEQKIPDIYFKMDDVLSQTNALAEQFTEFRDSFALKNKPSEGQAPAA